MTNLELPPLTWLRAFEAAARLRSFTLAGAELHVTQAAVSKHLKSLEMYLGHALFIRHPRRLELTKSGEAYLPKVQDALERLALGTREVFGRRRGEGLTLRCAVSFAAAWLAPRLPDFFARHPGVGLRVVSSVWNDAVDKAVCDLDIRYGKGDWPGYRSHRLTWEMLTPLCAPGLAGLRHPDDLRAHRLLHVLGYHEGWGIWLAAAAARQVDPGQGVQLDNSLTAFALAAAGGGIALGRTSLAAGEVAAGRLVQPFDLRVPVDEGFFLLEPDHGGHPDAAVFAGWITRQAGAAPRG